MGIQARTAGILINNCDDESFINNKHEDIAKKHGTLDDPCGQHAYVQTLWSVDLRKT